jgi:hypothetical protein
VSGEPVTLPVGTYRVVVSGGDSRTIDGVMVPAGGSLGIDIDRESAEKVIAD